jgi:hypothetical protein
MQISQPLEKCDDAAKIFVAHFASVRSAREEFLFIVDRASYCGIVGARGLEWSYGNVRRR